MKTHSSTHEPKIILCVAAHPDDLEATVGGSVAKWVAEGAEVHFLVCTGGEKGAHDRHVSTADVAATRRAEQQAAAQVLGVKTVTFLHYEDGQTQPSAELKQDIVREIRRHQPDTVVTLDPQVFYDAESGMVNHTDHRAVGEAVIDAVYPLARDHLSFPALAAEGYEPHRVSDILLMQEPLFTAFPKTANYFVDISTTFDAKIESLAAHKSQIDMTKMYDFVDTITKAAGTVAGYDRAEAFIRIHMSI